MIIVHPASCVLPEEFPRWKQVVWKLFGVKREHSIDGYYVKAYYFRGKYLVVNCEEI